MSTIIPSGQTAEIDTFTWRCPMCGRENVEPLEGARMGGVTPCCGLPSSSVTSPGKGSDDG